MSIILLLKVYMTQKFLFFSTERTLRGRRTAVNCYFMKFQSYNRLKKSKAEKVVISSLGMKMG